MDIVESIYKVVVEPVNRAGHGSLNRGESALSNTYYEIIESVGKRRKRYVDYLKGKSKPTCLIHVTGNSSDECKALQDFCCKYDRIRPTKYCGHNPVPVNSFNRKQENNAIVNSVFY